MLQPMQDDLFGAPPSPPPSPPSSAPASPAASAAPGGRKPASRKAVGAVQLAPQALRSEEHTSELQSPCNLVCRLLLEKKNNTQIAELLPYLLQSTSAQDVAASTPAPAPPLPHTVVSRYACLRPIYYVAESEPRWSPAR